MADDSNKLATPPRVWVCAACGKQSRSRSGYGPDGERAAISDGWDSSCTTWAVLCVPDESSPSKWRAVDEVTR